MRIKLDENIGSRGKSLQEQLFSLHPSGTDDVTVEVRNAGCKT